MIDCAVHAHASIITLVSDTKKVSIKIKYTHEVYISGFIMHACTIYII